MALLGGDAVLARLMRVIMKDGKKSVAQGIVEQALWVLKKDFSVEHPVAFVRAAVENAKPLVECSKLSAGGRTLLVPAPVTPNRQEGLALRFIRDGMRKRKERGSDRRLAMEIMDLSKNQGLAKRRRDEMHKVAEANKAFAYLR